MALHNKRMLDDSDAALSETNRQDRLKYREIELQVDQRQRIIAILACASLFMGVTINEICAGSDYLNNRTPESDDFKAWVGYMCVRCASYASTQILHTKVYAQLHLGTLSR